MGGLAQDGVGGGPGRAWGAQVRLSLQLCSETSLEGLGRSKGRIQGVGCLPLLSSLGTTLVFRLCTVNAYQLSDRSDSW